MGQVIEVIRYGTSTPPPYMEPGHDTVPFIRATDIKDGEVSQDTLLHIEAAQPKQMDKCRLSGGELIIVRSGANTGDCAVVPNSLAGAYAAYDLILTFRAAAHASFIAMFLDTEAGRLQLNLVRGRAAQPHVNAEEVSTLRVPLPPPKIQAQLVAAMETARAERRAKLAEANALLAGLDDYLLATLGLTPPPRPKTTFALHTSELTGVINPDRYRGLQLEKHLPFTGNVGAVGNLIEERCAPEKEAPMELWDWIRIDDLPNQPWQVETLRTEPGENIRGAFFKVEENDILIARLGPTIQNSKFVLCPKLHRQTVASSEFLILRCATVWQPEAVLWLLRTGLYREMMYARSRGATPSRYRLDGADLVTIPFPAMDEKTQKTIAAEASRRRDEARRLRFEAEAGWEAAKRWFEEQLLGPMRTQ